MYDTEQIANRISLRMKAMGLKKSAILADLQLGINAISQLSKGHGMSYLKFAELADKLDCSVDFLLGRAEHINVSIGHINGDNSANDNGNIQINTAVDDGMTMEFMAMFEKLSLKDRIKVMNYAFELSEKK